MPYYLLPGLPLVGYSAAGKMSALCGFRQDSICLLLFVTDSICISSGCGSNASLNTETAVQSALNQAIDCLDDSPSLCIAFANNLTSCPPAKGLALRYHNFTMVTLLIGEKEKEKLSWWSVMSPVTGLHLHC